MAYDRGIKGISRIWRWKPRIDGHSLLLLQITLTMQ
jgi:hypothetical protein